MSQPRDDRQRLMEELWPTGVPGPRRTVIDLDSIETLLANLDLVFSVAEDDRTVVLVVSDDRVATSGEIPLDRVVTATLATHPLAGHPHDIAAHTRIRRRLAAAFRAAAERVDVSGGDHEQSTH